MLSEGFQALAETLQEAAHSVSHTDLRTQLQAAVRAKHPNNYPSLLDVFGDESAGDVVFQMGDRYHRAPYSMSKSGNQAGSSTGMAIGDHHEVTPRTVYHKVKKTAEAQRREAQEAAADIQVDEFVAIRESSVAQDGTTLLKLIAPGKGSSGYYSEAVLKRDGPKVFRAGTKNFWNHQTPAEEAERPEGNLDDLASVLSEDAYYAEGPAGPGLYAKAKVYEHYRKPVDEMSKDIGISIRAQGRAVEGTLPDGTRGRVIDELSKAISVDYVTTPGAGGKVVSLFEAARLRKSEQEEEITEMNEADVLKLIETKAPGIIEAAVAEKMKPVQAENRKLREKLSLQEAATQVDGHLAKLDMHANVKARVKRNVIEAAGFLNDAGEIDAAKLKEAVEKEAKDQTEYLASLNEGGRVLHMGATAPVTEDLKEAEFEKEMIASFMQSGLSEAQAKIAAKGRAA